MYKQTFRAFLSAFFFFITLSKFSPSASSFSIERNAKSDSSLMEDSFYINLSLEKALTAGNTNSPGKEDTQQDHNFRIGISLVVSGRFFYIFLRTLSKYPPCYATRLDVINANQFPLD